MDVIAELDEITCQRGELDDRQDALWEAMKPTVEAWNEFVNDFDSDWRKRTNKAFNWKQVNRDFTYHWNAPLVSVYMNWDEISLYGSKVHFSSDRDGDMESAAIPQDFFTDPTATKERVTREWTRAAELARKKEDAKRDAEELAEFKRLQAKFKK